MACFVFLLYHWSNLHSRLIHKFLYRIRRETFVLTQHLDNHPIQGQFALKTVSSIRKCFKEFYQLLFVDFHMSRNYLLERQGKADAAAFTISVRVSWSLFSGWSLMNFTTMRYVCPLVTLGPGQ